MNLQELAHRGQSQNFRLVGTQILGIQNGYPFSLTLASKGKRDTVTLFFSVGSSIPYSMQKAIFKRLPRGSSVTRPIKNRLMVTYTEKNDGDIFEIVMAMLNVVSTEFSASPKAIIPATICPICKHEMCDSAALVAGQFVPVHRQCAQEQTQRLVANAELNQESGNYLTGFIGALLGAIVGCIPTIATILLLKTEFGLLYMLIPLTSYGGYRLFKGRLGGIARIAVILTSLLAFVIMQPSIFYIFYAWEGYRGGFLSIFQMYFTEYIPYLDMSELVTDIGFGVLFLIVGIISSFSLTGSTNRDRIVEAGTNMDSITPLKTSFTSQNPFS